MATAVFAAQGRDVDTVVIDGRVVMRNRVVLTMDEAAVLDDVRGRFGPSRTSRRHRAGVRVADALSDGVRAG